MLAALRVCYTHAVFLPRTCAQRLFINLQTFLGAYKALARHALDIRMMFFGLKPKFHALHHILWDVKEALRSPAPWCSILSFSAVMETRTRWGKSAPWLYQSAHAQSTCVCFKDISKKNRCGEAAQGSSPESRAESLSRS